MRSTRSDKLKQFKKKIQISRFGYETPLLIFRARILKILGHTIFFLL